MNILHVIPGLKQASGPTAFCVNICDQLDDEQTHVAILHGGKIDGSCCLPRNQRVQVTGAWHEALAEGLPDIVHVHALWAPLSHTGVQWACRHKVPCVVSPHGMLAPWAMRHKRWKKQLAWQFYQRRDLHRADIFHATAENEVRWLHDLGFSQPCMLVPLGSDLPGIDATEHSEGRPVRTVLFVGRIYPVKGLMNLVKAWPLARNARMAECESAFPWQLIIAGPDQAGHKAELVAEAKKRKLTVADVSAHQLVNQPVGTQSIADIIFTGPVYGAEKDELYRISDLFVLPSFTENFGVVVTDALSFGLPVITTRGTPWSELLSHRCGWWINIGVEPLADALREAMNLTDGERHVMGENCRKLVAAKYIWPVIADQMKAAYHWMLNGGTPPACVRLV